MDWAIGEYITVFYVCIQICMCFSLWASVERDYYYNRNNTILVKIKSVQDIKVSC